MDEVTETPAEAPEAVPTPTEAQEAVQTSEEEAAPPPEQAGASEPTSETSAKAAPFDPYEALDREEMKPVLEQRDKRREREQRAELAAEYAEKTRNWEATQTANTLAGYFGNIFQKLSDSDTEGFDRSIQSMQQFAAPLMSDYKQAVQSEAARNAAGGLYQHMADALKNRDRDQFEKYVEDPKVNWPDAFKEYVRLASGEELAKKDSEITKLNDTIGRLKAEGRTDKGPATPQSNSGGAGLYSKLTPEQRAAMSPAERDAAVARELQQGA